MELKRGEMVAIYRPDCLMKGGWFYKRVNDAKVLGVIDGYAMLRYPRAFPFIESVKNLEKWKNNPPRLKPTQPE